MHGENKIDIIEYRGRIYGKEMSCAVDDVEMFTLVKCLPAVSKLPTIYVSTQCLDQRAVVQ